MNIRVVVGFEVFTAVVINVAIFWDIAPCGPYVKRRFGRTYQFYLQDLKSSEQAASMQQLAVENPDSLITSPSLRYRLRDPPGVLCYW
jgi:hypothetical protein